MLMWLKSRLDWLKSKLVDDWRDARRWWSVRINAIGMVILPLLVMVPALPTEIQAMMPPTYRAIAVALWCAASIAARMIKQKDKDA
jgi:hypothetical protein